MNKTPIIAILGPTASGKTRFATALAEKLQAEIVCMDSTTVYRGLDIGSGKPSAEDREKVPHHLLDILNPDEPFSAYHFVHLAEEAVEGILSRGKLPIVVGGTYFYLRAMQHGMYPTPPIPAEVLEGIEKEFFEDDKLNTVKMHAEIAEKDPDAAKAIHQNDRYRCIRALAILRTTKELPSKLKPVPPKNGSHERVWMKYAMALSRGDLNHNIQARAEKMISQGLVEETKKVLDVYPNARCLGSVGYAEAAALITKKITDKQLRNEIIEKTRQLAKRQVTWLRSDHEIRYIDYRDLDRVLLEVSNLRFALGETA